MAGARHQARRLRQQRRFADPGIAAGPKAPSRGQKPPPVTRSSSAMPEGSRGASWLLPVRLFERKQPAFAFGADRDRHRGRAGYVFLHQRIPLAAGLALPLPAIIRRAAVLTDEGEDGFGHGGVESLAGGMRCVHSTERVGREDDNLPSQSRTYRPVGLRSLSKSRWRSGSSCRQHDSSMTSETRPARAATRNAWRMKAPDHQQSRRSGLSARHRRSARRSAEVTDLLK